MNTVITIECPSVDEILARNADTLKFGSDIERCVEKWARSIGGQSKNQFGVNLAWELAVHDVATLPGAVPMIRGIMAMKFDTVLEDTFLPEHAAFVAAVAEIREAVLAELIKQGEAHE